MTSELRVYAYISTVKNQKLNEMKAFEDAKLLETEINKELEIFKALPLETKK